MAKTIKQLLDRAFSKARIKPSGADMSDAEYLDAISDANNIFFQYAADGLNIGWSEVSEVGDVVSVPFWAMNWAECVIAIHLCGEYGRPLTQELVAMADQAQRVVEKNVVSHERTYFPETLPQGGSSGYWDSQKYFADELETAFETQFGDFIKDDSGDIITEKSIDSTDGDNGN